MASDSRNPRMSAVDDDAWVGHHVVCLIDLMGQQSKLAQWATIPSGSQPTSEFVKGLKQTVGTILGFQNMFEDYFCEVAKPSVLQAWVDSLPEDKRQIYQRYKYCHLSTQQFGDTFVFYSPVPNANGDVSMVAPFRILLACCWAMIVSLAAKVPFRGAVCVGVGMELAEHNFYGPALAEVHRLESEVAGYPRIIVSAEAARFAQGNAGFSEDATIEAFMEELAATCRSLLCHDVDDQVIVDFLGRGMFEVQGGAQPDIIAAIEKAYRFVRSEALRFQHSGDKKHAPRYAMLQEYMKSRLPIWGLSHLLEGGNDS